VEDAMPALVIVIAGVIVLAVWALNGFSFPTPSTGSRYQYCTYRDDSHCHKPYIVDHGAARPPEVPQDIQPWLEEDSGLDYYFLDRGMCPHKTWGQQLKCPMAAPSRDV
jgi:hypothetical protein